MCVNVSTLAYSVCACSPVGKHLGHICVLVARVFACMHVYVRAHVCACTCVHALVCDFSVFGFCLFVCLFVAVVFFLNLIQFL